MKRKCSLYKTSKDGKRKIYIDTSSKEAIVGYIMQDEKHQKKFAYIICILLEGLRNTELYDKEDIDSNCKNVYAMKFFKGGSNDRIYCIEQSTGQGVRVIICAELYKKKKTQKLNKEQKQLIRKVADYEYEFE